MIDELPISVVIPTYNRTETLHKTLRQIRLCRPVPSEIIIHIDAGDNQTEDFLCSKYPDIRILKSDQRVGPGGGRNKLSCAASSEFVASFDDDSYPVDTDYFARLVQAFEDNPTAGVLGAVIAHRGEAIPSSNDGTSYMADFTGCGCAYRRVAWDQTAGYLPRQIAYGIEEVDLSLQLLGEGWEIIRVNNLRVRHDTKLEHHEDPAVTAGAIANKALLVYLRYPLRYLGWGLAQYFNLIRWYIQAGRGAGIGRGLAQTPSTLWQHRHLRNPVAPEVIRLYRRLRK
jgi:GT2 family glycosyltransferase